MLKYPELVSIFHRILQIGCPIERDRPVLEAMITIIDRNFIFVNQLHSHCDIIHDDLLFHKELQHTSRRRNVQREIEPLLCDQPQCILHGYD